MPDDFDVKAWIRDCIEGPGGMNSYEEYELVVWNQPERIAAAEWIVRCIGNPKNEGAREMVFALMRRHGIAEGSRTLEVG